MCTFAHFNIVKGFPLISQKDMFLLKKIISNFKSSRILFPFNSQDSAYKNIEMFFLIQNKNLRMGAHKH